MWAASLQLASSIDELFRTEKAGCLMPNMRPDDFDVDSDFKVSSKPWPTPLAQEAFHGVAGDLVKSLLRYSEADEAALLIQFIVAFGNMVGRNAFLRVGAAKHHCNLFVVLVGNSASGRKGTAWRRTTPSAGR